MRQSWRHVVALVAFVVLLLAVPLLYLSSLRLVAPFVPTMDNTDYVYVVYIIHTPTYLILKLYGTAAR